MEWIYEPWPWYVSGAAIAFVMLLLLLVGKNFGMSSNLRTLCTICGADKQSEFFKFDWKSQKWNLIVVAGAIIGGFLASTFLTADAAVHINPNTVQELQGLGFESAGAAYLPTELYATESLTNWKSIGLIALGGFLVGFGARYAGGCTSGHAISGLSNLQWPSLVAVIGFFAGGMIMIYLLFPLIFS
ncbi:YeeE/YedE family protein [Robiginitalea sediminis]|uniref:YeeE/YedE family protein n=1 Tax=Robiginitalea sediminis TaxID=1982593 RepID=UPI000B4AA2AA|nr:YeeE/YedE thiosulfate transporter family protein [Robiginitalea sediminis]